MKFSSGHGYAHPKSKEIIQRKAWVKILKNSLKQYRQLKKGNLNASTIPDTPHKHIHIHTHTPHTQRSKTKQKKNMHYFPSIKIYQSLKVPSRFLKSSHLDNNQRNATKTYQPLNRQQQFLQLLCNVLYIVSSY